MKIIFGIIIGVILYILSQVLVMIYPENFVGILFFSGYLTATIVDEIIS